MSDNTQEKNIFIFDAAEGMVLSLPPVILLLQKIPF